MFYYYGSRSLNGFNASSIAVFRIKTTRINHLDLFYDFCCIVFMVERFWSCTDIGFQIDHDWLLRCYKPGTISKSLLNCLNSLRDVDGPRDFGLLERLRFAGFFRAVKFVFKLPFDTRSINLNGTFVTKSTSSGSWNLEYFLIRRNSSSISTINRKTNNPIVLSKITKSKL